LKITPLEPPRRFVVGVGSITISHCADVELASDEQVTFVTPTGKEHDFVAKSWGFYATPSVNGRLLDQGFKTALSRNAAGRYYVNVVDMDAIGDFLAYVAAEQSEIVEWLDERP
jgi:hypothetical protein